jgi:lipid-A-disaccharide synthase
MSTQVTNKIPVLIIAGEKSGEEHALSFLPQLIQSKRYHFFGVCGEDLADLGVEAIYQLRDFSSMGFTEVFKKIFFYLRALKNIEKLVAQRRCQVAILVDFQGFNLKLAERLKKQGVSVFYYVAPQAWVWKPWRAKILAKSIHTLFTLLPFEKKWFADRGVKQIVSVAHPLYLKYQNLVPTDRRYPDFNHEDNKNEFNLLLLPGSRKSELLYHLPIMVDVIQRYKLIKENLRVILVKVSYLDDNFYNEINPYLDEIYDERNLSEALLKAHACVAASGTVTLATGLFLLPTVVIYKASWINVFILKLFLTYDGPVSLTNIILKKIIFPECLNSEATAENILENLIKITQKENWINAVSELKELKNLVQGDGVDVGNFLNHNFNKLLIESKSQ